MDSSKPSTSLPDPPAALELCPKIITPSETTVIDIPFVEIFELPSSVKDLSILIPVCHTLGLIDYLEALIGVIRESQIRYAYRTDGFFAIFMDTKKTADYLVHEIRTLCIADQVITIFPIPHLLKKIYFKCSPFDATNSGIQQELVKIGVKVHTPVEFVPVTTNHKFQHILSGRRQTNIFLDDIEKLPQTIKVEGFPRPVEVIFNRESCPSCERWKGKLSDLIAILECQKKPKQAMENENHPTTFACPDTSSSVPEPNARKMILVKRPSTAKSPTPSKTESKPKKVKSMPSLSSNVGHGESDSDESSSSDCSPGQTKVTDANRRRRAHEEDDLPTWQPLRTLMNKPFSPYPLNFDELKQFIKKTKRMRDDRFEAIVQDYTKSFNTDVPKLAKMLKDIRPMFPLPKWKSWCTRLIGKLDQTPELLRDNEN